MIGFKDYSDENLSSIKDPALFNKSVELGDNKEMILDAIENYCK